MQKVSISRTHIVVTCVSHFKDLVHEMTGCHDTTKAPETVSSKVSSTTWAVLAGPTTVPGNVSRPGGQ
ncbi:hypothetical protein KP509_1Z222400 [Ceratopteris richardii]|nr:hypothetical protein KP509_1Z222400 [Ceratopteris richardii]